MRRRRPPASVVLAGSVLAGAVLASGSLAGGSLAGGSPAAASTAPARDLAATGNLAVTGHGWGHGHGLSQYGSEGAGVRGYTAAQILAFYYPGTLTAALPNAEIRVLITERTGHLLFASARAGLQLRDAAGGLSTLDPTVPFWRLGFAGGYLLQRLSGTTWLTVRTSPTPLGFVQASSVREWAASGDTTSFAAVASREYRGELRLIWDGASTTTVDVVPMESYLRGVVPRESPSSWPAAALQSQAVAARSYSAYKRAHSATRSFDVYDTTADQVYGGLGSYATAASPLVPLEAASTDAAILATAGQVRTFAGSPILAQFSSSNGGFSADGGQPYLRAAADPFEAFSNNPFQTWTVSLPVASLRALAGLATVTGVSLHRETPAGGHVATADLSGSDSAGRAVTVTRTGEQIRSFFGWRSTYFSFGLQASVSSDFTGDGRSDLAVFRPSTGQWFARGWVGSVFGRAGDLPLDADLAGVGRSLPTVFRPATGAWYAQGMVAVQFGTAGDVPVPARFTGSGRDDVAVFRPPNGTWYVRGRAGVPFGRLGDVPAPADFTGDGLADPAVFRPSSGTWYVRGLAAVQFGQAGDLPVARDFTGDGLADLAVFRPSNGTWYVRGQSGVVFGQAGDVPVAGDADGNGRADVSLFRPATSTWFAQGQAAFVYGQAGDVPIHR